MSTYTLPAGTVVKFGTISTSLYAYFRNGIPAIVPRVGLEPPSSETDRPVIDGIYVGELMAYFSAFAAFGERTSEVHAQHQEVMSRFVASLQNTYGERPQMPELESIAAHVGLPVVLEIVLGEDCEVHADQHFEPAENSERSWKLWRSVLLNRENGIPSTWIKKFYFPRLLDYRDVNSSKNPRLLEQTTDSALMVGGMMQSWHKDAPGELLLAFKKQYGRTNFSQAFNFDELSLERFFNLTGMLDPATRLLNQMTIWQDVDALAKKQGIPLQ
jgi:hypothetical protein